MYIYIHTTHALTHRHRSIHQTYTSRHMHSPITHNRQVYVHTPVHTVKGNP